MTAMAEPEIGRARVRKEDEHLITGRTRWTDNITVNGLLHLAILRSPMAHARIDHVDVTPALPRPGEVAAKAEELAPAKPKGKGKAKGGPAP